MANQIFVNLPVKDLERSMHFFKKLGYSFNKQFTDEKAACMIIGEQNYVMLLTEPFFKSFTNKAVPDTAKSSQVIIALDVDSRQAVDSLIEKAEELGATITPTHDHGFMYQRGFEDPDRHMWEVFWMDPAASGQSQAEAAAELA